MRIKGTFIVLLMFILIISLSGCITREVEYHYHFEATISEVNGAFEIFLPIAIVSPEYYSEEEPPEQLEIPIEAYNHLQIKTGSGEYDIIKINETYYLKVVSNEYIKLGFDIIENKATINNAFSSLSSTKILLNYTDGSQIYLDFVLFSYISGSSSGYSFAHHGYIVPGWQNVSF